MQLRRKLTPLLTAAVGAVALMMPTPVPGQTVDELAPLPPIMETASADFSDTSDPTMVELHLLARAALADLQARQQ
jgi:hypothetical protein